MSFLWINGWLSRRSAPFIYNTNLRVSIVALPIRCTRLSMSATLVCDSHLRCAFMLAQAALRSIAYTRLHVASQRYVFVTSTDDSFYNLLCFFSLISQRTRTRKLKHVNSVPLSANPVTRHNTYCEAKQVETDLSHLSGKNPLMCLQSCETFFCLVRNICDVC